VTSYLTNQLPNPMVNQSAASLDLNTTFAALSDPTRRAILARLASSEATVSELAAPFDMSGPAISRHLKVLERAGLISRGRQAQWRPCRLRAGPLKGAADWLQEYRRFWEESLDRLDDYLRELQAEKNRTSRLTKKKKGRKD
jgi:DNA-binding transcriptional ArsR family regulator